MALANGAFLPEEGIAKYTLEMKPGRAPRQSELLDLESWRQVLFRTGLIGQDPQRYGGLAYGNVSVRVGIGQFVISGTQTGARESLTHRDYCLITDFDLANNRLGAEGLIAPSSEALTHGALYRFAPWITCVLHVHSKHIWSAAMQGLIDLPVTPPALPYGTPEIALAMADLARAHPGQPICMGGHRDGIVAYATTIEAAGARLLATLTAAISALTEQDFFTA